VLDVPIPAPDAKALHDLGTAGRDSVLLLILTVALVVLALLIAVNRARTLRALGLSSLISGLLTFGGYLGGRGLVVNEFSSPSARTAAGAAWKVYLGGLETSGLVLAGSGAAIVLAVTVGLSVQRQPRRQSGPGSRRVGQPPTQAV
jgi:hypothetical protein